MDYYDISKHPGDFAGNLPVAASAIIPSGGLVAVDASGNAVAAASTVAGFVAGRAEAGVDNSAGAAGAVNVLIERGVYEMKQADANPVTKAHIGKVIYAITPDSVAHTGTCAAGKLLGFSAAGLPIVDTRVLLKKVTVALTCVDGVAAGAVDLAALKTETEKVGDDLRAIYAALVAQGILG